MLDLVGWASAHIYDVSMSPIAPRMRLTAGLCVIAVGLLTSCASAASPTPSPSPTQSTLYAALRACNLSAAAPGFELGDAEMSLVIDTSGEADYDEYSQADYLDAECVLDALEIPDATMNLVETTRALDGRQNAEWENLVATWSYHPDAGLNMTLQTEDE